MADTTSTTSAGVPTRPRRPWVAPALVRHDALERLALACTGTTVSPLVCSTRTRITAGAKINQCTPSSGGGCSAGSNSS